MKIRKLEPADWATVSEIYAEGIATGNATFETEVPSWDSWDSAHISDCRFVAEVDGQRSRPSRIGACTGASPR